MNDNQFDALLAVLNSIKESLSIIDESLYNLSMNTKLTSLFGNEYDDDEEDE